MNDLPSMRPNVSAPSPPQFVPFREAVKTWARVAALSFGGPAGQIAVMHRILVEEKKWISEERFLHALNYCMLLPGPEATQLATYVGWLLHRAKGGVVAGVLFILPGFIAILALSILYALYQQAAIVQAIFFGLKPAVMAIVLEAVIRIGRRVLKNGVMLSLAAASFIAIYFFNVPFPAIIAAAGAIGFLGGRMSPRMFAVLKPHGAGKETSDADAFVLHHVVPTTRRALFVSAVFLPLWFGPVAAIGLLAGPQSVFFKEGVFFSKAAVVTFGGAYAVLPYVAQEAVEKYGWLQPGEMLDGLGMAETTPGPLIMVVEFVGFLGAYRSPDGLAPLVAGVLGAVLTTWVTFVPCFYWIFLGAPYLEQLRENWLLTSALSAVTAAVVGVVLNLAVWFSLHTLFAETTELSFGPLRFMHFLAPDVSSLRWPALFILVLALALTFVWKRGMAVILAACCVAGVGIYYVLPLI